MIRVLSLFAEVSGIEAPPCPCPRVIPDPTSFFVSARLRGRCELCHKRKLVPIDTCTECKQPLIEVDNRGKHLRGCLSCNESRDRDGNLVRLSEKDLAALQALRWNQFRE